jgi:tetratricopeptide (TPR) repeat protein
MPSEPALVRLNVQVERRLKEMESTRLVESTIQACRDLRPREALELVRKSRQQMPTDDRLLSLEARLNERIQQLSVEERRADFLSRAEEALKASRFSDAVHILEACQAENLAGEEVTALLQFARNEEEEHDREQLKRNTLGQAQRLMDEGAFNEAIALLQNALSQSEDSTLRLLMSQAHSSRDSVFRQADAALQSTERMVRANKVADAVRLLKSLPKEVLRSPRVQAVVVMLDDEQSRTLYRHVGRAYALLSSDPGTCKAIALRVGSACDPNTSPSEFAHALNARIGY